MGVIEGASTPQPELLTASELQPRAGEDKPWGIDVFCNDVPSLGPILTETKHFIVIPDAWPVTPGHLIIIPKQHFASFAEVPQGWEAELQMLIGRLSAFIDSAYHRETLLWENGGIAQSVPHAHLHLMPFPHKTVTLPPSQATYPATGFGSLRRWWRQHGPYHLLAFRGEWRILPPGAPDIKAADTFKGETLGTERDADGRWVRKRQPTEVARTHLMWQRWDREHAVALPVGKTPEIAALV